MRHGVLGFIYRPGADATYATAGISSPDLSPGALPGLLHEERPGNAGSESPETFLFLSLLTHSLSLVPLSDTFAEPHLFKPQWHSQEGAGPSSNWSRDVCCSQGQQPPTVAWKCAQDFPWIVVDADAGACYVRDVRLGASLRPGGCATLSCGRTGYGVGRKRGQRAVCSYGYVSKPWPGRDRNWSVKLVFWTGCARMRPNGVHKQSTQRGVPVRRRSSR